MNILVLGSGGREHTLCWKIADSNQCTQLYAAPGNAGTDHIAQNVDLDISNFEELSNFAVQKDINLIIVGPEQPLVEGIYDYFQSEKLKHIKVLGPSKAGAQLEGSKAYAKKFMARHNIPTAAYGEFSSDSKDAGIAFINTQKTPIVLKCDGLAAGKGVLILDDYAQAEEEFTAILDGKFGGAGNTIVVEDFLDGIEFSVFALTDGKDYQLLPVAKDYKRIGEGDTGLNTGGMGAISPPPFVDDALMEKVINRIVEPTIKGLASENINYHGFVFFGLIKVGDDPYVIEYNCRMGDPESEAVIPRINNDFVSLCLSVFDGTLDKHPIEIKNKAAATVMLVSGGYPGAYEKDKFISGLNSIEDSIIFHAGTTLKNGKVRTNGGRVLAITSFHENFRNAVKKSVNNAGKIDFENKYFRSDIGFDLL